MIEPWREAEVEVGQERDARDPTVKIKDGKGLKRHVKQSTAAQAEQKFRNQYDASGKGRRGRGW